MTSHVEVRVTAGSREAAEEIVRAVVEARAAACAQVSGPVTSTYWWRGEIHQDEEHLILMKTTKSRLDELVDLVRAVHSYETPEIVAVPIEGGLPDYLNWITAETAERPTDG